MKPREQDPTGRTAHAAGAKLDLGKPRAALVTLAFSRALLEVAKVGTFGAGKYSDNGWLTVPDGERRYSDALLRHLLHEGAGETFDAETGLRHAAHAAWNALARLELALRKQGQVKVDAFRIRDEVRAELDAEGFYIDPPAQHPMMAETLRHG